MSSGAIENRNDFRERSFSNLDFKERSIDFREIDVEASDSLIFRQFFFFLLNKQNIDDVAFVYFSPLDLMKIYG